VATRSGRRSRLTTILSVSGQIRFDQGCMAPADRTGANALRLMAELVAESEPIRVEWRAARAVVIDNWRCLHGRGTMPDGGDPGRRLLRILLNSNRA
jgi:hypothetical protein